MQFILTDTQVKVKFLIRVVNKVMLIKVMLTINLQV